MADFKPEVRIFTFSDKNLKRFAFHNHTTKCKNATLAPNPPPKKAIRKSAARGPTQSRRGGISGSLDKILLLLLTIYSSGY